MKKFTFVSITDGFRNRNLLNIGYLCSALKKVEGLTTQVLFYDVTEFDYAIDDLMKHDPWVIGISILQYNFNSALDFAKRVKERYPEMKIIFGGLEASRYAKYILENYECVDIVVLGEGEISLSETCRRLLHGESLEGCKSTYYRENGEVKENDPQELIEDLDSIDFPDRSFCNSELTVYNILGSRGCFGSCLYCESNCIFGFNKGPRVRVRSMKNVLDEIESIVEGGKYAYIGFADYTFSTNVSNSEERLIELYNGIIDRKLKIQFSMFVRAEQVTESFIELMLKLQKVGLDRILIGLEFGTQEELKMYAKTAKLEDNERALDLLEKHGFMNGDAGIILDIGFIPFHAYTTFDLLQSNIDFIRRHKLANVCAAMENRMYISGSTAITRKLEKDGLLRHDMTKPLINPYCYVFQDPRIGKVYASFVEAMGRLELEKIPTKILTNYVTYRQNFGKELNIHEIYENYQRITETVLKILEEIMESVKTSGEYSYKTSLTFPKYLEETKEITRKLVLANSSVAKKLLRINKLAIPDLDKIYVEDAKKAALNS